MKGKDIINVGLAIIAGIFIYAFFEERNKNKFNELKIKKLERDRLKLIKSSLEKADSLPEEVKKQILDLVQEYKDVDADIAEELSRVLSLVNIGQQEEAIKNMAKIIERLLSEKFKEEDKFKKNKKFIPLKHLIDHAKETSLFTEHEYNASCILRDIRNEVSHELNVQYGANWQIIGLLGGIEIIFKLKGVKIN